MAKVISDGLIPDGKYKAVVAYRENRLAQSGNRYLHTRLVVINGEWAGSILYANYNDTEKARWVWGEVADSLEDIALGLQVYVRVRTEEWQGEIRNLAGKMEPATVPDQIIRTVEGTRHVYKYEGVLEETG